MLRARRTSSVFDLVFFGFATAAGGGGGGLSNSGISSHLGAGIAGTGGGGGGGSSLRANSSLDTSQFGPIGCLASASTAHEGSG